MAEPGERSDSRSHGLTSRPRRSSLRKSAEDCSLPTGYLEALEVKRRSLDESIHKFIATKEREFKQYEKELKYQTRRASTSEAEQKKTITGASAGTSTTYPVGAEKMIADHVSELQEHAQRNKGDQARRKQEDFSGVFTPPYLSWLDHNERDSSASGLTEGKPGLPVLSRHSSDQAQNTESTRKYRLGLSHRTSSSGSSIDGRLISAMKSLTEAVTPRRKRVSIAVGDAIVAPTDNVPISMSTNSTSSHSRARAVRRHSSDVVADQQFDGAETQVPAHLEPAQSQNQGSATTESSAASQQDDIGDLFDLEGADDIDMAGNIALLSDEATSSQDSLNDEIAGRVAFTGNLRHNDDTTDGLEPGETRQQTAEDEDDLQDVPLTPITAGAAASAQPVDAGFRRPSAMRDPSYEGISISRPTTGEDIYSSSFSKSGSRGASFTSGSLGESYMAKNAQAMMEMRAQQQDQHDHRHRSSHSGTVMPVR